MTSESWFGLFTFFASLWEKFIGLWKKGIEHFGSICDISRAAILIPDFVPLCTFYVVSIFSCQILSKNTIAQKIRFCRLLTLRDITEMFRIFSNCSECLGRKFHRDTDRKITQRCLETETTSDCVTVTG